MKLVEQFLSVQGEGVDIGKPMIFIRFAGCNLQCSWCDTKFSSWYSNEWYDKSIKEILKFIKQFNCQNVSLTGGEPLIQSELPQLAVELKKRKYSLDIQSNGTLIREELMNGFINQWSLSPKLSSSVSKINPIAKTKQAQRIKMEVLKRYRDEFLKYQNGMFKFVVENKGDLVECLLLLKQLDVKDIPVILQPQGLLNTSVNEYIDQLRKLTEEIIISSKLAKVGHLNLRILPQLHRILWNNQRQI